MRSLRMKVLVVAGVLASAVLMGRPAGALSPYSIPGIQFRPETNITNWIGSNWVSGLNTAPYNTWVAGQFQFNGAPSTYLRGSLSQNSACYLLVTDTNGNVVSSRYTTFVGTNISVQQQFLGPTPTSFAGQAISVLCSIEPSGQIFMAWQQSP